MPNNIFSSEELDNMYVIINIHRNLVPDELNRDLRTKLNTICEKLMRLKEESVSAGERGRGEEPRRARTSHEDVVPACQPQSTSTPQPHPTSTPQSDRRRILNTDDAQPGSSRENVMAEGHSIDEDDGNETVNTRDEDTSANNLQPPVRSAQTTKKKVTVKYKTFVSGQRGDREGLLTFIERKMEQGKAHGKSDEVICDIIISNAKDEALWLWAMDTNCKDTKTLLKYVTSRKK